MTGKNGKAKTIVAVVAVILAGLSLLVSGLSYNNTSGFNQRMTDLQATNNDLVKNQTSLQATNNELMENQTLLQGKIAQLTENQTNLQQIIFEIQNPTPTITVQSILIGPPPSSQISVSPNGAVSFQNNATLFLNLTVFVSTEHSGELTIPKGPLPTFGFNASEIWIGFSFSGVSTMGYFQPIHSGTTETLSISMPFTMYYEFTNSYILGYPSYGFGYIGFPLEFTDLWTNSTYSRSGEASFQWNNSTSMS